LATSWILKNKNIISSMPNTVKEDIKELEHFTRKNSLSFKKQTDGKRI